MNIQRRTPNIQHPRHLLHCRFIGCSTLGVGCRAFLFLLFLLTTPFLFGQSETNALPELLPPYGQMPPTFWERHSPVNLVIVSFLSALAVAILARIFKPKPQLVPSPEIVAREALAKLQVRPEDGRLLSEVSQVLRRYIAAVFGLPRGEMTTTEFSAAVSADANISPQLADVLTSFLRACDTDKFSAKNEAPPLNAVLRASQFIEQIERRRQELNTLKSSSQ